VDGREFVVLHDEARRENLELQPETWAVLSCADGTRDVGGIVAAATRIGAPTTEDAVQTLLQALAERDLLLEGAPVHAPDTVSIRVRAAEVEALPVAPLPDYRFECDGAGGCCRSYGSVLLTPGDRDRARAALEGRTVAGLPSTRWFTPDRGSAPTPLAVPVCVDGGCGFLGDDGLCEIHRRVGLEGKPRACASFPLMACADGVEVRVSVVPECACVLRPVEPGRGEPLAPGWSRGADLPPLTVIDVLPDPIAITPGRHESRAWLRARLAELGASVAVSPDPAEVCWRAADAWSESQPVDVGPYVEALATRAKDLMRRRATYVPADDWVLGSLRWLVGTLHLLAEPGLRAMVVEPLQNADPIESRLVRAVLWGYQGFEDMPAAAVLRTLCARLWIARAMAEVPLAPSENAVPLATLSMLLRGHGLAQAWESLAATLEQ